MKIVRDGIEFELTSSELSAAYFEQQFNFDVEDVKSGLEYIVEDAFDEESYIEAARKVLDTADLLSDCAIALRRNIDKYGMQWEYARSDAIRTIVCRVQAELI